MPRLLVARRKYFDGELIRLPRASKYGSVSSASDALAQVNLTSDRSLLKKRKSRSAAGRERLLVDVSRRRRGERRKGFGSDFGWIDVDLIIDIDVSTRSFAHAEEEEKPEKDGDD